jgi:HEAT repeat protein
MTAPLTAYLEKLIDRHKRLDSSGVMQVKRFIQIDMEDVFIPLSAAIDGGPDPIPMGSLADIWESMQREENHPARFLARDHRRQEDLRLEDLFRRHPRWVLLGDPGAGKTTVLRHRALTQARRCLGGEENARLPVFVILRYFAQWLEESGHAPDASALPEYLEHSGLAELGFDDPATRRELRRGIETAVAEGKTLWLLDGLDEQRYRRGDEELRDAMAKLDTAAAVEALLRLHAGNAWLVSSRIIGYQGQFSGLFQTATLQPFKPEQRNEFLRKWMRAIERGEELEPDAATDRRAEQRANILIEQIDRLPRVGPLAANPLLCTIIGLIHHQGGGTLPRTRVELYKLCVDTFVFNWEMCKRRSKDEAGSLSPDETQAVLEPIALHFQEHCPDNRAHRSKLADIAAQFLVDEAGLKPEEARSKADKLLDLIRDVAGLFVERGEDEYGFFHLTFQEYLAARYITKKRKRMESYVSRYWYKPEWREVMRLAAQHQGQKSPELGTEFIELIERQSVGHDAELHYSFRFAFMLMGEAKCERETVEHLWAEWMRLFREEDFLLQGLLRIFDAPVEYPPCSETHFAILLATLRDEDSDVRSSAAQALGSLGDARAVEPLLAALHDEDPNVRGSAAQALDTLGDARAVEPLLAALRDETFLVSWYAAQALGTLGDARAVEPLLAALHDEDFHMRGSAALALGGLGDGRALEPLLAALMDEDFSVWWYAAQALGTLGDARAVEPLLAALHDDNLSVRGSAAQALGSLGDERALEPLIVALGDEATLIRWCTAQALGTLGDARAVEPLLAALHDKDFYVRSSAAQALGTLGDARAVEPLLAALHDEDFNVRSSATQALGTLGDARAVKPLLAALHDKDSNVRRSTVQALGILGDARAVEPLLAVLQDETPNVRSSAAQALGTLGDARAVKPLLAALRDKNSSVHTGAADALEKIELGVLL